MKLTLEIESAGDVRAAREAMQAFLFNTTPVVTVPPLAPAKAAERHQGSNGDTDWEARAAASVDATAAVVGNATPPEPSAVEEKPELIYDKQQMKAAGQINPEILELLKTRGRKSDDLIRRLNTLTAAALQDQPNPPLGQELAGETAEDLAQELAEGGDAVQGTEDEVDAASTEVAPPTPSKAVSVAALFNQDEAPTQTTAPATPQQALTAAQMRTEINNMAQEKGIEGIYWLRKVMKAAGNVPVDAMEPAFMLQVLVNPEMVNG